MTKLHRHQRESAHEEGEKQRQAVGIVESGGQHECQQDRESKPGARGQNIQPSPLQDQR
jgi:hypothetical protein